MINDLGKFVLRLLPSGVLCPGKVNVLGPGVALDATLLERELADLEARALPRPELLISDRAQILLEHHRRLDAYEEERLGRRSFGSTRAGIAPFYADKAAKLGVSVDDLFDEERLRARLAPALVAKNVALAGLYAKPPLEMGQVQAELHHARDVVAPFVADTTTFLLLAERLQLGPAHLA